MDTITLIIVLGGAGVVVTALVLFMLNRSWGDSLPTRIDIPQSGSIPRYDNTGQVDPRYDDNEDIDDEDDYVEFDQPLYDEPDESTIAPEGGLLLIEHPLLIQVIEKSLSEGGAATRYAVRDGDQLYISLDLIQDPVERRQAAEMIQKFQNGNPVGVWDMISLASTFGRR
jgi:hypothetical protein